jgi:HEAT repeat protein
LFSDYCLIPDSLSKLLENNRKHSLRITKITEKKRRDRAALALPRVPSLEPAAPGMKRGHTDANQGVSLGDEPKITKRVPATATRADAIIANACKRTGSESTIQLIYALQRLEPAARTAHAGAIVAMLHHRDSFVAHDATRMFMRLDDAALARHANAIFRILEHPHTPECVANHFLGSLNLAAIQSHADAIHGMFTSPDRELRKMAVETLCRLDGSALTPYASALVGILSVADAHYLRDTTMKAICSLQPEVLAPHVLAILRILAVPDVTMRYEHDSELSVRRNAAISLGRLEPVALTPHMGALVAILQDFDIWVRHEATRALGKVEQTNLIASHPDIIAGIRADSDMWARHEVPWALSKLKRTELTPHAGDIIAMLEDPDECVRHAAAEAFKKLDRAVLTPHASAFVAMLSYPDRDISKLAENALGNLDRAALTPHAGAIVAFLSGTHSNLTRNRAFSAVRMLEKSALWPCTGAIVDMLTHPDEDTRAIAVRLFDKLEYRAQSSHAAAIIGLLTHSRENTRFAVLNMFSREYYFDRLTKPVIAMARTAITNLLKDGNSRVREEAKYALENLKKMLVNTTGPRRACTSSVRMATFGTRKRASRSASPVASGENTTALNTRPSSVTSVSEVARTAHHTHCGVRHRHDLAHGLFKRRTH